MKKRILYFDKESTDRINDYLLRAEDYLIGKSNGSCLVLEQIGFFNFNGNIFTINNMPNILGPLHLRYFIQLNNTQSTEFKKNRAFK